MFLLKTSAKNCIFVLHAIIWDGQLKLHEFRCFLSILINLKRTFKNICWVAHNEKLNCNGPLIKDNM